MGSLLVAAPTTGKSFFLSHYKKKGVKVYDTDDMTKELIPGFFEDLWWLRKGKEGELVQKQRDIIVAEHMLLTLPEDALVLTNLWSPTFLKILFGERKPSLFIGMDSALEITRRSEGRDGHKLSTSLTSKWVNSAKQWIPQAFENFIWLLDDQHLTDVVEVRGKEFRLTVQGRGMLNEKGGKSEN